ncbi:hypothetical protein HAX54_051013 [Datura stramonium]|uniref:Pentatricopeptide repeat-containing protein n=1 Tax=Datura stramonium TaxID=4076 RepID=A0ABS8RRI0_DATST|nr:hypothetical protein [Datura stramonium]
MEIVSHWEMRRIFVRNGIPFISFRAYSLSHSNIVKQLGIPSGFILTSVINSYCLMHRVDCAFSVLPIYLKNGIPFNVVTFSTLIRGFFAENKVKHAVELFQKLAWSDIGNGSIPDLYTHCTLLNGYFKYGLVEEAILLFDKLERKIEYTNTSIEFYNVMINGLCKNGKLDKARALFEKLSFIGLLPDVRTYNSMINGFCLEGLLDEL